MAAILDGWVAILVIFGSTFDPAHEHVVGVKSPLVEEAFNNEIGASEEETDENSGYFEGDITGIDGSQLDGRNAILDSTKTWSEGVIPYVMSRAFSPSERRSIEAAFEEYRRKTCLDFVPRKNEDDFIDIIKGKGCYSQVGRRGLGGQEVSIGSGCLKRSGVILHELMHVAGFWHEQSRADRDDYVTVNWRNIKKGMEVNFNKYPWTEIQHLNESYDVASVMHYGPYSFSRNRLLKTIQSKDPNFDGLMGQREGFSKSDLVKINKLYKCDEKRLKKQQNSNKKKKKKMKDNKLESFFKNLLKYLSEGRSN